MTAHSSAGGLGRGAGREGCLPGMVCTTETVCPETRVDRIVKVSAGFVSVTICPDAVETSVASTTDVTTEPGSVVYLVTVLGGITEVSSDTTVEGFPLIVVVYCEVTTVVC